MLTQKKLQEAASMWEAEMLMLKEDSMDLSWASNNSFIAWKAA